MNKLLRFKYKGNRNYVHGTDIFNALLQAHKNTKLENIDIRFNGLVATNLLLLPKDAQGDVKVHISWDENGEESQYKLIESADLVEERYEYDEQAVVDGVSLDLNNKTAQLIEITPYTFCENLVAINKFLLQSLFPEENGKWYFTRLELDKIISDEELFHIRLVKNLGFRLTKSEIHIGNQKVGNIYFSMVK